MSKRDSRAVWVWVRLCTHVGLHLTRWGLVAMWLVRSREG